MWEITTGPRRTGEGDFNPMEGGIGRRYSVFIEAAWGSRTQHDVSSYKDEAFVSCRPHRSPLLGQNTILTVDNHGAQIYASLGQPSKNKKKLLTVLG